MKTGCTKKKATIPPSRWLAYATAGLATAAATAPCAEAEIHYFSPVRIHIQGHNGQTWRVPLTRAASLTFYRDTASVPRAFYSDAIAVNRNAAVHAIRAYQLAAFFYASKLRLGSNVSGGPFYSGFPNLIGGDLGQFTRPGVGFAGFKFDVGNGVQYGWVRLRTAAKGSGFKAIMTVLDYAFADPREPIAAGQRTENEYVTRPPAEQSLGALALGAAGLCAWRRRRASREK